MRTFPKALVSLNELIDGATAKSSVNFVKFKYSLHTTIVNLNRPLLRERQIKQHADLNQMYD